MKAFAENNTKVGLSNETCLDWVENIVGTGENAGYQHFLLFPSCFQKPYILVLRTALWRVDPFHHCTINAPIWLKAAELKT